MNRCDGGKGTRVLTAFSYTRCLWRQLMRPGIICLGKYLVALNLEMAWCKPTTCVNAKRLRCPLGDRSPLLGHLLNLETLLLNFQLLRPGLGALKHNYIRLMPLSHLALANTNWGALKPRRLSCPFCTMGRRNFSCGTHYFGLRDLLVFPTWSVF